MQQKNFGGAISYLTQAEQNGYKARTVEDALATSRFWYTMGEATQAFDDNQLDLAATKYRAALAMRPRSPGGAQRPGRTADQGTAISRRRRGLRAVDQGAARLRRRPGAASSWPTRATTRTRRRWPSRRAFPAAVKAALDKDPEYLRTLATIYQAQNRNADAQRVLAQALALPFPDNGATPQGRHQAAIRRHPDGGQALTIRLRRCIRRFSTTIPATFPPGWA